jgi:hypothetical protein
MSSVVSEVRRLASRLKEEPEVFAVHLEIRAPAKAADLARAAKLLGAIPADLAALYREAASMRASRRLRRTSWAARSLARTTYSRRR